MAEVSSYLNLLDSEPNDDPHQTLTTLDSLPYWSNLSDHLFSSDPQFPRNDLYPTRRSTVLIRSLEEDDAVSDIDSIANAADLYGRENQVNFVMDLFQQRVEQSQVMGDAHLVGEALSDSVFGVIEGNLDVGIDGLELDLGLGLDLGFGVERHCLDGDENDNCGFMVENCGGGGGAASTAYDDDDDGFFVGRRVSRSESGEPRSTVCAAERVWLAGFGSDDSDEDENDLVLGIDLQSENDDYYGELDHVLEGDNDDDTSVNVPLCWDSFQLENHREANEDFEWEEVDGRVDEREFLSMFVEAEDERSVSVLVSQVIGPEEEGSVVRVGGLENLGWEVLLNANNLETNPGLDDDGEPYFGDHEDYIHNADAEYEMLFGQFADYDITGKPPASKSVVQNLPWVVMTQEDVDNNNALCAVCKDDMNVGEQGKLLPCAHRYHRDCIVPWLGIRNTCPVCRYELPTDDADYERRRAQRASRGA
ncbi:uncharacterized protein LOC133866764 [Alnus glutinosa]|uniref:uncharacterized protein LOC133866764 n=1 Tax=Alnus glutinosa TaxID=3517 RepID=UPI002D78A191|nr:uncharacterized protein LOC133866764 [Alnus glutinosa]